MGLFRLLGKETLGSVIVTGKTAWGVTKVASKVAVGTTAVVAKTVYDNREGIAHVSRKAAVVTGKAALWTAKLTGNAVIVAAKNPDQSHAQLLVTKLPKSTGWCSKHEIRNVILPN